MLLIKQKVLFFRNQKFTARARQQSGSVAHSEAQISQSGVQNPAAVRRVEI
jgi:hypothetical protein